MVNFLIDKFVLPILKSSQVSDFFKQIVEESKKPWVNPLLAENERLFREVNRKIMQDQERLRKQDQDACPHIAGSSPFSEELHPSGKTSIVWHCFFPNTPPTGVCTNCLKQFLPSDEDYKNWRNKPSFNRISAGRIPVYDGVEEDSSQSLSDEEWGSTIQPNDDSSDPYDWSEEKFQAALSKQNEEYRAKRAK